MDERPRREITSRIIRPGEEEPPDLDWQTMSMGERIGAVWELTKLCYAWTRSDPSALDVSALRLQRSVVHIQRPSR
jgi:hypothetical protein